MGCVCVSKKRELENAAIHDEYGKARKFRVRGVVVDL